MKKIIIAPYSRHLRNGKENAKNYPYWPELINKLNCVLEVETIQIGCQDEKLLNTSYHKMGLSYDELKKIVLSCDTWISVDSFLPHMGYMLGKRGIVLFGKSDPKHFGWPENINLLKSRKYLRQNDDILINDGKNTIKDSQWRWWEDVEYNPNVFVEPNIVIKEVEKLLECPQ